MDHFPLLSTQDLADRYGVPIGTIYQWRSRGYGPAGFPVGRHVRYRLDDVLAWEDVQRAAELQRTA